jgi:hypothetical protein
MKKRIGLLGLLLLLSAPAAAEEWSEVTLQMADQTERSGRLVAWTGTDVLLQESSRSTARMVPLAEVREMRFLDGTVRTYSVAADPLLEGEEPPATTVRSSGHFRSEDLVLTRDEMAQNAIVRGILAGTVATFFTSDGDQKKIAFGAGFLLQFGVSLAIGW